jgi:hypothetical protein
MVLADVNSSVADSWTAASRNRFPRSRQLHVQMYNNMFYVYVMTAFFIKYLFCNTDSVPFTFLMLFLRCGIR